MNPLDLGFDPELERELQHDLQEQLEHQPKQFADLANDSDSHEGKRKRSISFSVNISSTNLVLPPEEYVYEGTSAPQLQDEHSSGYLARTEDDEGKFGPSCREPDPASASNGVLGASCRVPDPVHGDGVRDGDSGRTLKCDAIGSRAERLRAVFDLFFSSYHQCVHHPAHVIEPSHTSVASACASSSSSTRTISFSDVPAPASLESTSSIGDVGLNMSSTIAHPSDRSNSRSSFNFLSWMSGYSS